MKFYQLLLSAALTISNATFAANPSDQDLSLLKNQPVNFAKVKITDKFWAPRLQNHAKTTLAAGLDQCIHKTHRVDNFAVAAGKKEGKFEGIFYDDSDLYKMIEGAAYSLINNPDPALEARIDSIINLIAAAQMPDGYLMTYYILGNGERWSDMNMHEMYCCGHLIEAAIAYYDATGKKTLLDVATRFADHIDRTFGPGKRDWVPGHEEIELALVKLYRTTGEKRYLDLATWLLDQRGHEKADWSNPNYYQDLTPVRDLTEITGHAVRAMYLFTGMADAATAAQDSSYLPALDRLWNDVIGTKMYITGGIGSSGANEGFTKPYDLPNETAYCETCASVGMILWNQRMNMLRGEAKYIDILERSLYNGALAGVSLSGDRFFYVNPLASNGSHHRQAWYGTACCPSQIARFLPSIGNYIYATSNDALWVNLFIGSLTTVELNGTNVLVNMQTDYPWNGFVRLQVNPSKKTDFEMRIRIPGWCKNVKLKVNENKVKTKIDNGYAVISRKWAKGDIVTVDMDMPVEVVAADPRVEANQGRRAIQRGPIVYCLEQTDNPDIANAALNANTSFSITQDPRMLGGIVYIDAKTASGTLRFIPYSTWDNREPGAMEVWVPYKE